MDDLLKAGSEGFGVEVALEFKSERDVVSRIGGMQLIEEPQSLLRV
jgi:hypothetical protein